MSTKAQSSPNIALIKYWGKRASTSDLDRNIGLNTSVSMTLSKAQTHCEVSIAQDNTKDEIIINDQVASDLDQRKVALHLDRVFSALKKPRRSCIVKSQNNFPMGTGIASSASAFSALTLASIGEILGPQEASHFIKDSKTLSSLSRRGSGSAARSIEGPFCIWENEFAQKLPIEWKLYDTILILSRDKKLVSSSDGHQLAESSPHMNERLANIPHRLEKLLNALKMKSLKRLGPLIEEEAREMHLIMESSSRSISYQLPQTRQLLAKVEALPQRDFFWTLDAGPNPHFISERPIREDLEALLKQENIKGEIWEDECGYGARLF